MLGLEEERNLTMQLHGQVDSADGATDGAETTIFPFQQRMRLPRLQRPTVRHGSFLATQHNSP